MYMQMHLRRSLATATAHCALLPLQRRTYAPHTRSHAVTNSCCPSVEPHPFRSKEHSTASGAPDEHTLATAVPGSSDPRSSEMREPCRPFGRLAMTDQMDRCSGAPPLHLGWVTRGAGPSGERGERARARPGWQRHGGHANALAARTSARADERACDKVM